VGPYAQRTETRPVGSARPFAGAREPELAAWVRLVDDDLPPDEVRLMIFIAEAHAVAAAFFALTREVDHRRRRGTWAA